MQSPSRGSIRRNRFLCGQRRALCGLSLAVEKNQALVVVGLIFIALHAIFMIEDAGSSRNARLGAPR